MAWFLALVATFAAGGFVGWTAHTRYVRQMWKLARGFRNRAMGGKRGDF